MLRKRILNLRDLPVFVFVLRFTRFLPVPGQGGSFVNEKHSKYILSGEIKLGILLL